ncbi:leech-derived tryptase inhibitor C-like [Ostrinia furnacalis]|uniref:leech-derived tryptase inhibitor C-like n=1 Tax=Ostrinia furnacalis TaxID=93504 RepID=UPI00103C6E8F|nr:leech-derived tryptase inhibitor C-like [Ostrinia furnacalis]
MKLFYYALTLVMFIASMMTADAACICPAVFDPVCATNGQTYSNSCQLGCAGAKLKHKGACGSDSSF